jgi:hypothetical protein
MFDNVGIANSAGVATAMIVVASVLPTLFLQWRGETWRAKREALADTV